MCVICVMCVCGWCLHDSYDSHALRKFKTWANLSFKWLVFVERFLLATMQLLWYQGYSADMPKGFFIIRVQSCSNIFNHRWITNGSPWSVPFCSLCRFRVVFGRFWESCHDLSGVTFFSMLFQLLAQSEQSEQSGEGIWVSHEYHMSITWVICTPYESYEYIMGMRKYIGSTCQVLSHHVTYPYPLAYHIYIHIIHLLHRLHGLHCLHGLHRLHCLHWGHGDLKNAGTTGEGTSEFWLEPEKDAESTTVRPCKLTKLTCPGRFPFVPSEQLIPNIQRAFDCFEAAAATRDLLCKSPIVTCCWRHRFNPV